MLLENADAALYWAKRSGPRPDRALRARRASGPEAEQRNEVAALLEQGTSAIAIVFQPVVELATGRAGGYEALARIDREPRRGPGRVVRAGAPRRARARSSRRSRCAPR